MKISWLEKLEAKAVFTEPEAWNLFRLAALGEAVGWTLLISGIVADHYIHASYKVILPLAGQIHGLLFLLYFACLIATYSSLRWPRPKFVVALIAGVVPYGTLAFELVAAHYRKQQLSGAYRRIIVRAIVINKDSLLAVLPSGSINWQLPGGEVKAGETNSQALLRILQELTAIRGQIGRLRFINESAGIGGAAQTNEFYYLIVNGQDFIEVNYQPYVQSNPAVEDLRFVKRSSQIVLEPAFLQAQSIKQLQAADQTTTIMSV